MRIAVVTLANNSSSGARAPLEIYKSISLLHETKLFFPNTIWQLINFKPDVISFHSTFPYFIFCKLLNKPIVTTYYGTQFNAYLERFLPNTRLSFTHTIINHLVNIIIYTLEKLIVSLSDQVVAISHSSAVEVENLYHRHVSYVYLGSNHLPHTDSKIKTNTKLLSVSRITPYKGFHTLIEMLKNTSYHLTIAGPVHNPSYLAYLQTLNPPQVTFHLNPTDQQLAQLYRDCSCYITADRYLFFGLPIVESATFSKPALALNHMAAPELIHHAKTGYVANTPAELLKYLTKVSQSPHLHTKLGQAAKQLASTLTWEKTAQNYSTIFANVVRRSH